MTNPVGHALSTANDMPYGMRYSGQPDILMLHIASDGLIALGFLSIAITLVYFARKRTDLQFNWILLCFAVFIVACGVTHLTEIWTIWHPSYRLFGAIKATTALASLVTSILLIKLVPYALRLPRSSTLQESHLAMEREVGERIRAEDELRKMNATLEARVADRTAQLAELNRTLTRDNERFAIAADAARRADERFHLAIEAAPTGMLMMDRAGTIVLVNAQVEKLFGYRREELLGRQIEMLVPERFHGHHPELRRSFFDDPKTRAMGGGRELFGLRKDGREVPIEIGLNPLHTSEGDFVLGSIVDLSQRREIDRMRSEFISTVSHELRTPLTSISGSLGLLQSGAMGSLSDKAATMVRIAYKNSERLARIINDILDIGKLEAGQLTLQLMSIPLSELLRQSLEINSAYAEKYQVRFLMDVGPADDRVMADPDRLMQVVTNLLSNAAKFSPPGADVLIRLLPDATTLRIEVEDSGQGIPDAFQDHIFEKFAQADASPTRRFEGTGLGLSIARKLIEAMGGSIGFTTVVGRGTIFHLELPRTDAESIVLPTAPLSETAAHRVLLDTVNTAIGTKADLPRLLFVEDDEDLISVIGATLAGKARVVPAHSLHEAELLLRDERFDLVVLDQTLPDGSGLSLVDRIPALVERVVPTVILLATDPPRSVHGKVAAVLVKSQISAAQAATTILSYLPANRR
jgi:PAS domain S-box-containing protein